MLGLDPSAPGLGAGSSRVHLHADPLAAAGFVEGLYRVPVVVFAVDVSALRLLPGDDDDEGEFSYPGTIRPERLTLL